MTLRLTLLETRTLAGCDQTFDCGDQEEKRLGVVMSKTRTTMKLKTKTVSMKSMMKHRMLMMMNG